MNSMAGRATVWVFGIAVIPGVESHLAVLATDQAMIGDGHSVGVATDIRIDLLRTSKRFFGINDHFWRLSFLRNDRRPFLL